MHEVTENLANVPISALEPWSPAFISPELRRLDPTANLSPVFPSSFHFKDSGISDCNPRLIISHLGLNLDSGHMRSILQAYILYPAGVLVTVFKSWIDLFADFCSFQQEIKKKIRIIIN